MSRLNGILRPGKRLARDLVGAVQQTEQRVIDRLRRFIVKLAPLSQYKAVKGLRSGILHPPTTTTVPGPRFAGDTFETPAFLDPVIVNAPLSEWVEFKQVKVVGGSPIIFAAENVGVHADAIDPHRDVFLAETVGVATFEEEPGRFHLLPVDAPPAVIPEAVSIVGEYTGNYAHWLLETLPNLVALDSVPEFRDLPLLVDGWLHPIFFETLALMNRHARPILRIGRWEVAEVGRLITATPSSFTAEKRHTWKTKQPGAADPDFYQFNPNAIAAMRKLAVQQAQRFARVKEAECRLPEVFRIECTPEGQRARIHQPPKSQDLHIRTSSPRRLYFRRVAANAGNPRMMIGEDRVENILSEYGFLAVNPAALPFAEQVLLTRQAECIVAPIGASLANLVFAEPGCKVIIISPYYKGAEYYYFSNLMGVLGHEMTYVLGPQVDTGDIHHHQHKHYWVDTIALREALKTMLEPAQSGKIVPLHSTQSGAMMGE